MISEIRLAGVVRIAGGVANTPSLAAGSSVSVQALPWASYLASVTLALTPLPSNVSTTDPKNPLQIRYPLASPYA